MNNKLVDYLTLKGQTIPTNSTQDQLIIDILEQKERQINNLYEQITKYKSEDSKNQKLIKSLQDKIAQLAPSVSDTGSNFMMASEFKTNFQELMTTMIPSTFGSIMDRPYLFAKCVEDLFTFVYRKVEQKIDNLVLSICKLIGIDENSQNIQMQSKTKISLLKIMQEHWQKIIPYNSNIFYEYQSVAENNEQQMVTQLNELLNTQEYKQILQTLHKIVVYMILQDKKWQFNNFNNGQVIIFNKKDFICIDGWIKEGSQGLLLLGGLKRDNHQHPNLKNFVIPFQGQEKTYEYYKYFTFHIKQQQNRGKQQDSKTTEVHLETQNTKNEKIETLKFQFKLIESQFKDSMDVSLIGKNKSLQMMKWNKQNLPNLLNKKSKKKDRLKILQNSLKDQKSPSSRRRQDESLKRSKLKCEEKKQLVDDKIVILKDEVFSKKKHSTMVVNKNTSNSHQAMFEDIIMLPLKRKAFEELPVSKQVPIRKKTKPSTSRKNSVGKIVNQQHIIHNNQFKDKQNSNNQLNGVKSKNKQKIYKDIIKQKLFQDKASEKTQHSLTLIHQRPKNDKQKKNDENRPLKIQSNANKLRQKYVC